MTHNPHILVFDSGVGGLSIAREILQAFPHCQLTYASDNAAFPYGNKTADWLVDRVERVMARLLDTAAPDIVVIACNTASTLTLPRLREQFSVPFVGVVPAIKPAAHISRSKTIGVLATPATIARPYTQQLIRDFAADCRVILHGSGELVAQAERKLLGQPVQLQAIADEILKLVNAPEAAELDTIVLACTHFPLLGQELAAQVLPRRFQWVDSGEAIARRVGYWIGQLELHGKAKTGIVASKHPVILTAPIINWPLLHTNMQRCLKGEPMVTGTPTAKMLRGDRPAPTAEEGVPPTLLSI